MSESEWSAFLDEWSDLIMWLAKRRCKDYDGRMQVYAMSLEKIRKALDSKRGKRGMKAWLGVIVGNCHAQMLREKLGRRRYPKMLSDTTEMDMYGLVYWEGFDYHDAANLLGLDRAEMVARADRVERLVHSNDSSRRSLIMWRARGGPSVRWAAADQLKSLPDKAIEAL